jgi:hypothetical protein
VTLLTSMSSIERRTSATDLCFLYIAQNNGVQLYSSRTLAVNPALRSSDTLSSLPWLQATCKGEAEIQESVFKGYVSYYKWSVCWGLSHEGKRYSLKGLLQQMGYGLWVLHVTIPTYLFASKSKGIMMLF